MTSIDVAAIRKRAQDGEWPNGGEYDRGDAIDDVYALLHALAEVSHEAFDLAVRAVQAERLLAEAERRGAVKALRKLAADRYVAWDKYGAAACLQRADAVENGSDL